MEITAMDFDQASICINEIFPVEIMDKFFSYLDTKELLNCMKVCKCWRFQIDKFIGIDLHIGSRNNGIWKNYEGIPFGTIKAMKQFGSRKVFISELENPRQNGLQAPVPTDIWKEPDMIQYLWVDGYLRQQMFRNVIHGLKYLQQLEIHFNTLASLNPGDLSTVLSLESLVHLKSFVIRMFTVENVKYQSFGNGLSNAIGLFASQIKFPRLRSLFLSFPFCEEYIRGLCQSIAKFIIRNSNTLGSFKLNFSTCARSTKVFPPARADNAVTVRDLAVLDLNSIEIHSLRENHPEIGIFQELINGQKNLAVIHSTVKFLPLNEIAQLLRNSFQTLNSVQLSIDANPDRPIDLNIFASCNQLKRLELIGKDLSLRIHNHSRQEVIGGGLIPKTLEILSLIDLNISSINIHDLINYQKNLKSLRCVNIGNWNDLGISFGTTLCEWIDARIIEKIFLQNSINKDSIANGKRAVGNSGLNLAALIMYDDSHGFCFRLNEQKYYIREFRGEDDDYDTKFPDGGLRPFIIHRDELFDFLNLSSEATSDVGEDSDDDDENDFDSGSESDDDADYHPPGEDSTSSDEYDLN